MLRTHSAAELGKNILGSLVTLAGWVDRRRDHGGLIFIDLRDRSGVAQVVFNPEHSPTSHALAGDLRSEYVIQVMGEVALRPAGTENPKLPTGEIEVLVKDLKVLNTSETPPFYINEDVEVDENLRLVYRYMDMRRARLKRNIILRHALVRAIRNYFDERGFVDIETPILGKSTPEGARDYLVPSRVHAGKFYALPQSPQQMKQLLMVGGLERYYQIARCFRDEDTRADRQPEFTQLDVEMSFVTEEDVLSLTEELFTMLTQALRPDMRVITPFPRIPYREAMAKYGCDKPDLRFGMEIGDVTEIVADSDFAVFRQTVAAGGVVRGLALPGRADISRSELAELTGLAQSFGAKGLLSMALMGDGVLDHLNMEMVKSVAAKYLTLDQIKQISVHIGAKPGDLILLVADESAVACRVLGRLRGELGVKLGLADPRLFAYCFIVDFPLLAWSQELGRWEAVHHPFTSPVEEDISLLDSAPGQARSRAYDIVLNGYEAGGGSIRIHQADLQRKMFRLMGYTDDQINERFGHLLTAFSYGAPPHGGIALGIDRVAMLFAGEESIREVIAFPKNQQAMDMLFDAPAGVEPGQLKDLHIRPMDD
ncbi:MAG: aspartate--tRNA ligase [Dehalococcoidia bacterium]|nr:aspartate--tRNA ligase [Dehalococcoidia bacterium]